MNKMYMLDDGSFPLDIWDINKLQIFANKDGDIFMRFEHNDGLEVKYNLTEKSKMRDIQYTFISSW